MKQNIKKRPRARTSHPGPELVACPGAPKSLSSEASGIWDRVVQKWVIGDDAIPILEVGLEAWDRYRQAAEILKRDGPVVVNPSGAIRAHPAHAIARDNLTAFRQCFRQLHLDPPGGA